MTLYEYLMACSLDEFSKKDWAALGRGEISDDRMIKDMLAAGYEAINNEQ
jgi:hypothetical protein